jgi:PII-like signaling protein
MTDPIKLMRIYTDEAAYFGDRKVFEVVAERARAAGLAGATVLRALIGFGHTPHLHRRHVLDDDQSLIVEVLDRESKLRTFLETLADLEHLGPVTLEAVEVLRWPQPTSGEVR